jgi:phosphate acetyltransferase
MGMELINQIKENAKSKNKTIILPESHDERVLKAAEILTKEQIAKIVTLGNPDKVLTDAEKIGVSLDGVEIVDHLTHPRFDEFAEKYFLMRQKKGITKEQAIETMKRDLFFAAMMLREGLVDGSVAGSFASTADVMKAGIQIIGMPEGISIVSSFFLMIFPDKNYSFADCAVVPNPTDEQLADIAISTADNHKKLTGEEPLVAMLSFSTKGSATHELADKVISATNIVKSKRPDLMVDGELQFDAAIIESIGKNKAPGSKVAGKANVLVFPDLNAGNIGYKIAQRLGGAEAVGPMVQGLNKPFFDLSRGCSVEDIVNTTAINVLMGDVI